MEDHFLWIALKAFVLLGAVLQLIYSELKRDRYSCNKEEIVGLHILISYVL